MIKLLTVDVWDTLLRRDCHPECIKLATAQYLRLGWFYKIRPEFRDCRVLYLDRIEFEKKLAERSLAKGQDGEYEITNVIEEWLMHAFYDKPEKLLINKLIDFEISTEIERTFVDPEIQDFLDKHKSEKRIFLSDFYMRTNSLNKILEKKGILHLFDGGVSSCEIGLNKRSGRLFKYIHELVNINPKDHVHIGDNYWSDYKTPDSLGINAFHYEPKVQHDARLEREDLFSQEKLFNHISKKYQNANNSLGFSLGIDSAPFIIGFLIWVTEQVIIKKIDQIYFIDDEGEFLESVYNKLFSEQVFFGHQLPPCGVLKHKDIDSIINHKGNKLAIVSFLFSDLFEHPIFSSSNLGSKFITLTSLCQEKNESKNFESFYFLDSQRSIISDSVLNIHNFIRVISSSKFGKLTLNSTSQNCYLNEISFNFYQATLQAVEIWKPFVTQYVITESSLYSNAVDACNHAFGKYKKEFKLLLSGKFLLKMHYIYGLFIDSFVIKKVKNFLDKIKNQF